MEEATVQALERQRNRAIATVLGAKDACDPYLPRGMSRQLRKAVLDAINDLHNNTLLIVSAADEGMTVNELIVDKVARLEPTRDDRIVGTG